MQMGTLAKKLQAEPPPKVVKVTLSEKIPLSGDELKAYEEEQSRLKEEAKQTNTPIEDESHPSPRSTAGTSPLAINIAEPGGGSQLPVEGLLPTLHPRV